MIPSQLDMKKDGVWKIIIIGYLWKVTTLDMLNIRLKGTLPYWNNLSIHLILLCMTFSFTQDQEDQQGDLSKGVEAIKSISNGTCLIVRRLSRASATAPVWRCGGYQEDHQRDLFEGVEAIKRTRKGTCVKVWRLSRGSAKGPVWRHGGYQEDQQRDLFEGVEAIKRISRIPVWRCGGYQEDQERDLFEGVEAIKRISKGTCLKV